MGIVTVVQGADFITSGKYQKFRHKTKLFLISREVPIRQNGGDRGDSVPQSGERILPASIAESRGMRAAQPKTASVNSGRFNIGEKKRFAHGRR